MQSQNPFAPSPNFGPEPQVWQGETGQTSVPERTTGLTVVMVLFFLFGILGILSGIGALFAVVFEQAFQGMGNPEGNPMVKKLQEIQAPFRLPGLILAAANTILSVMLLSAGVGLATRKRWGWTISGWACMLGIGFELMRLMFGLAQQGYTALSISSLSPSDLGKDVPEQAGQFMAMTMSVVMIFGMFTLVVYAIGKILVYYFSRRHLQLPEIARLFS